MANYLSSKNKRQQKCKFKDKLLIDTSYAWIWGQSTNWHFIHSGNIYVVTPKLQSIKLHKYLSSYLLDPYKHSTRYTNHDGAYLKKWYIYKCIIIHQGAFVNTMYNAVRILVRSNLCWNPCNISFFLKYPKLKKYIQLLP